MYRLAITPVSLLARPPLRTAELVHIQRLLRLPLSSSVLAAHLRLRRRLGIAGPFCLARCVHTTDTHETRSMECSSTLPAIDRIKPLELHWPVELPVATETVFVYIETQPQLLPPPGTLFEMLI